jgi:predicted protein tyrosine phosphatase
VRRLLFVCSRNWRRSPTAEAVCRDAPGVEHPLLREKRVATLGVTDDYAFMDPMLVERLVALTPRVLS